MSSRVIDITHIKNNKRSRVVLDYKYNSGSHTLVLLFFFICVISTTRELTLPSCNFFYYYLNSSLVLNKLPVLPLELQVEVQVIYWYLESECTAIYQCSRKKLGYNTKNLFLSWQLPEFVIVFFSGYLF